MVFSSTTFLFLFLPLTLSGYYLIRQNLRNAFLLLMSLVFYAVGEPFFVYVMLGVILANYFLGILLSRIKTNNIFLRRLVLGLVIITNLGILFYYKYYGFFIRNINYIFGMSINVKTIVLPIGISFFIFQCLSYIFDLYLGRVQVQENPLNLALYIALFPQLIAGPIVRYSDINSEIKFRRESLDDFASGIQKFSIGLAKKAILSNQFALLADTAFETSPNKLTMGMAWLGVLAYTFQIYFDFSGYSDMAIGLGRMFGFHFLENFNYPYIATNITNFWRRWHISLSSWFRDYVYIPLGGNRRGNVYINLLIVFILTGLWHGASWNFVIWGLWHGFFLIMERIFRNHNIVVSMPKALKWSYTIIVVMIGWVFFRASNLQSALEYLKCMTNVNSLIDCETLYTLQDYAVSFAIACICALPLAQKIKSVYTKLCNKMTVLSILEPLACGLLLLLGISYTVTSTYNPFIYFNF